MAEAVAQPPSLDSREYGQIVSIAKATQSFGRFEFWARWQRKDGLRVPELLLPLGFQHVQIEYHRPDFAGLGKASSVIVGKEGVQWFLELLKQFEPGVRRPVPTMNR